MYDDSDNFELIEDGLVGRCTLLIEKKKFEDGLFVWLGK